MGGSIQDTCCDVSITNTACKATHDEDCGKAPACSLCGPVEHTLALVSRADALFSQLTGEGGRRASAVL